jgi:hypothetical protein
LTFSFYLFNFLFGEDVSGFHGYAAGIRILSGIASGRPAIFGRAAGQRIF